jgi:hypothetical protein
MNCLETRWKKCGTKRVIWKNIVPFVGPQGHKKIGKKVFEPLFQEKKRAKVNI